MEHKIDIGLICETWLTSSSEAKLDMGGYNYVCKLRSNKKGGGVCILVKDGLLFREVQSVKDLDLECCAVKIKTDLGALVMCSAYKPPNSNNKFFLDQYDTLLKRLRAVYSKSMLVGLDHNMDLLKHSNHCMTQEFLDVNFNGGLFPLIIKPTRITKSSAILIDNIFAEFW